MNSLRREVPHQPVCQVAERILFSCSLEEKLRIDDAGSVSFEPSSGVSSVGKTVLPGRPETLRFGAGQISSLKRENCTFPATPHLVTEENRGILLHFFANHELLAAELMSLALLRFPDAPTEFRKGLYQTLREEQRHTKWYIARMNECGVAFGDYPVNGFFWDSVSQMESPMDYVSRLSLTFEQANLDYARHFATILDTAGDPKSAAIMRQIYQDEIAHVSYGLKWFRKWKNKNESDWDCLERTLTFPVSPSRAKGNNTAFNREGRLAAGFTEDYIDQLSVFGRSRGRTPNLFVFNPEAEEHIAALPKVYQADKTVNSLIGDLEILSVFLARRDDVVLVRKSPSLEHLAKLLESGFVLPEIEELDSKRQISMDSLLNDRRIHSIRPWACAPNLEDQFGHFLKNAVVKEESRLWERGYDNLFCKSEQSQFFSQWQEESYVCKTSGEMNEALALLNSNGYQRALIKAPISAAGRGLRSVSSEQPLFGPELKHALRVIAQQGSVLIEALHQRVFDFSAQFLIESDGSIRKIGMLRQLIDKKGNYRGTVSPVKFCQELEPELARFLMNTALPLYEQDGQLATDLTAFAAQSGYHGPMGVDAYVYRDNSGILRHRMICEVNPRYTMGRLTLELRKQIAPGRNIRFEIIRANSGSGKTEPPPLLDSHGKIESGHFILNEIKPETFFAAKITVSKNIRLLYD